MSDYHINIFWNGEGGCYVADIPDLRFCSAFGDTPEEFELHGASRYIAIDGELLSQLESRAAERGISLETLVNLWLQERLSA